MATQLEYLCILPDFPDAQSKRLEVRASHLENAKSLNSAGTIPFAGAMIEEHTSDGQTPQFKGSVIVLRAGSVAECKEILSRDVYVKAGVWDMDKATITAFKTALTPK